MQRATRKQKLIKGEGDDHDHDDDHNDSSNEVETYIAEPEEVGTLTWEGDSNTDSTTESVSESDTDSGVDSGSDSDSSSGNDNDPVDVSPPIVPPEPIMLYINPYEQVLFCSKKNKLDPNLVDVLVSSVSIDASDDSEKYLEMKKYYEGRVVYENYTSAEDLIRNLDPREMIEYSLKSVSSGKVSYKYLMSCNPYYVPLNFKLRFGEIQIRFSEEETDYKNTDLCQRMLWNPIVEAYDEGTECMLQVAESDMGEKIVELREVLEYGVNQRNYSNPLYLRR